MYFVCLVFHQPEEEEKSIMEALQKFLEGSTLGEFRARLEMIYAFHCQLVNMDASHKQGEFLVPSTAVNGPVVTANSQ